MVLSQLSNRLAHNAPLVVERLDKRYHGGVHANREISFEASTGEMLGILGPNGAGKTTLVRQITTELLPSSGSIRALGVDVVADPIAAKNLMGIVPQLDFVHLCSVTQGVQHPVV